LIKGWVKATFFQKTGNATISPRASSTDNNLRQPAVSAGLIGAITYKPAVAGDLTFCSSVAIISDVPFLKE